MTTTPSGLIIAHDSITAIPLGDHTTIHEQVGGWFDCARQDDLVGYVHDEGLLLGLPLNPVATALFGRIIVGNCVVYNSVDSKGDYDGADHPLSLDQLNVIAFHCDAYQMWIENYNRVTEVADR
jgi:hypothetical protein